MIHEIQLTLSSKKITEVMKIHFTLTDIDEFFQCHTD